VVAELSGACDCRKPAPGMLLAAALALDIELTGSWMVGDTDADLLAGRAAGCRTILVRNPGSAHKRGGEISPDAVAGDLAGAVDEILRGEE
jgi:D-glycero-D-manno-heptose 1,7-bisphosphate phosphatase